MSDCHNHRVVMVSSELIWENQWAEKYGHEPIAQKVLYICRSCKLSYTHTFYENTDKGNAQRRSEKSVGGKSSSS